MTEDDKVQLEPYRCKHGCERDELKDRIEALSAENERLQTQYDEMGNAMLNHIGKSAAGIVRLELENDGLKAENEKLTARVAELEDVAGDLLTRFDPWSPHDHDAAKRARAALGKTK